MFARLALISIAFLLTTLSAYAIETDLLSDPQIVKAFKEDGIEIVKIEKILTDVNISKNKKGYTVIMAKARMPKVANLGNNRLKHAYNPWTSFGLCVYARNSKNDLHILFVILTNKKKLDAILYEGDLTVSLETKVDLVVDSAKNYQSMVNFPDRAIFALSSEGCDEHRYFAFWETEYSLLIDEIGDFD
jgi:hypothetical protein